MHIILLGTAAGGGFPQWNCACVGCGTARRDPGAAVPRTQSSVAVSADGRHWFLLNASPDVRAQLTLLPAIESNGAATPRHLPIEGVVLTDAELDHTLGLLLLREGGSVPLYATGAVVETLERDLRILPVLRAFAEVPLRVLAEFAPVPLRLRNGEPSGLTVEAFGVGGHPPRFAGSDAAGHTVGLLLRDGLRVAAYLPGCAALDPALLDRLAGADLVLFDGTFWSDDELAAVTGGGRTAGDMGHLPISGPAGSLEQLRPLGTRVVYVHLNNTNPVLLEGSPERAAVRAAGMTVGADGMTFTL
jgi:pyrroloquinoline quinone biosynthesis protein B